MAGHIRKETAYQKNLMLELLSGRHEWNFQFLLYFKRISFFFFLTCLFSLPAGANIGIDWIAGKKNADGAYALASDVSTPYQSTAEVLRATSALGVLGELDVDAALDYLDAEPYQGTEYLARRIIAWNDSGRDVSTLLLQLGYYEAVWGGFGDLAGYEATVPDTAFALLALHATGESGGEVVARAVGYLLREQNPDGGWSWVGENVSSFTLPPWPWRL